MTMQLLYPLRVRGVGMEPGFPGVPEMGGVCVLSAASVHVHSGGKYGWSSCMCKSLRQVIGGTSNRTCHVDDLTGVENTHIEGLGRIAFLANVQVAIRGWAGVPRNVNAIHTTHTTR